MDSLNSKLAEKAKLLVESNEKVEDLSKKLVSYENYSGKKLQESNELIDSLQKRLSESENLLLLSNRRIDDKDEQLAPSQLSRSDIVKLELQDNIVFEEQRVAVQNTRRLHPIDSEELTLTMLKQQREFLAELNHRNGMILDANTQIRHLNEELNRMQMSNHFFRNLAHSNNRAQSMKTYNQAIRMPNLR